MLKNFLAFFLPYMGGLAVLVAANKPHTANDWLTLVVMAFLPGSMGNVAKGASKVIDSRSPKSG